VITLIAATALLQGQSFFARTFPNPTGNNGWEEYTMAADYIAPDNALAPWTSRPNDLVTARANARRFARVVERYVAQIQRELSELEARELEMFKREERFWKMDETHYDDPLIEGAMELLYLPLSDKAARVQTQLRLAAIHCRIIEFKRTHNRWPIALTELGGREVWYDPASGGPFYYAVLSDQSYTLYSLGTPETGRIDLRYQGPPR
jgi:hypothetical protein